MAGISTSGSRPQKKKKVAAAVAAVATKKKTKTKTKKFPPGFNGCKTCGGTDHRRCTVHKCPKHPHYEPRVHHRRRGSDSSYEMPAELNCFNNEEYGRGGGDWSGRPGHRCQLCGRSSEGVGPRRGFDYTQDVCGGCTDLD